MILDRILVIFNVYGDRRLPEEVARDPVLHAECLGGALYQRDFEALAKAKGFKDPRMLERAPITIQGGNSIGKLE